MSPSWHDQENDGWRDWRRYKVPGTIAVAVLALGGTGLGVAMAGTGSSGSGTSRAGQSIVCPAVADRLPDIPASAQAEVDRNLALLDTQLREANNRLANSEGEGGANFVQNAILGPLEDKRAATLDRIAISIGRTAAKPTGLNALAPCNLAAGGGGAAEEEQAEAPEAGAGEEQPEAGAGGGAIACPTVADQLPAIPAQALAEVERNLALLETQIEEANTRLADSVGQGGPAFVQNAILGPLEDKRIATINRIATAIGRNADRPDLDVAGLAPCDLNEDEAPAAGGDDNGNGNAGGDNNDNGGTQLEINEANDGGSDGAIVCATVADQLPAIPDQALAEVERNLAQLETQIQEAETRLANSVGEGGPAFVQNAILGPLEDKRVAAINRIATAIGRNADRPNLDVAALAPCAEA